MNKVMMLLCVLGISGGAAFAEDTGKMPMSKKMPAMTSEQRQKMADAHEKMAACLRSDKELSACREEMMKSCKDHMGKDSCPMMGGKGMGKHHGKMDHED